MDFLKKIFKQLGMSQDDESEHKQLARTKPANKDVHVIPRSEHSISRKNIHPNALKVLYRLSNHGYQAYLVGGSVRDILLGHHPKDFDVVTDATPEQVKKLFVNCRLIGRRFRLAHIHFGKHIIEVATFRGNMADRQHECENYQTKKGMIVRDNVFGTIEEDAFRRDFSINALFYSIKDFSLFDYTGGLADIEEGTIRVIGDPEKRYAEDPVRMLRAVRFAAKLDFDLDEESQVQIHEQRALLNNVPTARLFEEIRKFFLLGYAKRSFELLLEHNLLGDLFSQTYTCLLQEGESGQTYKLLRHLFKDTDARVKQNKSVTPAFLFSGLLWSSVQKQANRLKKQGLKPMPAIARASEKVMKRQLEQVSMPKHFAFRIQETWILQEKLKTKSPNKIEEILNHNCFRAAYDLLLLRARSGERVDRLADAWTEHQKPKKPKEPKNQ